MSIFKRQLCNDAWYSPSLTFGLGFKIRPKQKYYASKFMPRYARNTKKVSKNNKIIGGADTTSLKVRVKWELLSSGLFRAKNSEFDQKIKYTPRSMPKYARNAKKVSRNKLGFRHCFLRCHRKMGTFGPETSFDRIWKKSHWPLALSNLEPKNMESFTQVFLF